MDDLQTRCIQLVAESKKMSAAAITPESSFESLGMDSLDKINLSFAVEEAFGIAIPDENLNQLRTVGDMIRGVEQLLAEKNNADPATA